MGVCTGQGGGGVCAYACKCACTGVCAWQGVCTRMQACVHRGGGCACVHPSLPGVSLCLERLRRCQGQGCRGDGFPGCRYSLGPCSGHPTAPHPPSHPAPTVPRGVVPGPSVFIQPRAQHPPTGCPMGARGHHSASPLGVCPRIPRGPGSSCLGGGGRQWAGGRATVPRLGARAHPPLPGTTKAGFCGSPPAPWLAASVGAAGRAGGPRAP